MATEKSEGTYDQIKSDLHTFLSNENSLLLRAVAKSIEVDQYLERLETSSVDPLLELSFLIGINNI